jgi:hypothetical protein
MTIFEKTQFIGTVFMGGVKAQLSQSWTWGAAASVGLYQGLKYKGSIRTGMAGGVATLIVLAGAAGLYNVVDCWGDIKRVFKEKED